jgi:hypothetical protein
VVPVSLGGDMVPDPTGVRVLCRPCNSAAMREQRAALTDGDDRGVGPSGRGPSHREVSAAADYSPAALTAGDGR